MKRSLISLFAVLTLSIQGMSQKVEVIHLSVGSGNFERINSPVSFGLENVSISDTLSFQLFEKVRGNLVPKAFQIEPAAIVAGWHSPLAP